MFKFFRKKQKYRPNLVKSEPVKVGYRKTFDIQTPLGSARADTNYRSTPSYYDPGKWERKKGTRV